MASARSTVSIARTTPAQKPRGEHNITFRGGFGESVVMGSLPELSALKMWLRKDVPVKHGCGRKAKGSLGHPEIGRRKGLPAVRRPELRHLA
jgi:hypothetical protein